MHILKFRTLLASKAGEGGYFKINASVSVVALKDSLLKVETNFKMLQSTLYKWGILYLIGHRTLDMMDEGSSKVQLLKFKKYVRLSRAEKGVLSLNYFELNLNSNFWLNLTLVVHAPLATPTEHLRLLRGKLVMTI